MAALIYTKNQRSSRSLKLRARIHCPTVSSESLVGGDREIHTSSNALVPNRSADRDEL